MRFEVSPTNRTAHASPACARPRRREFAQGEPLDRFEGTLEAAAVWMLARGWWPCGSCLRQHFADVRNELRARRGEVPAVPQ